MMARDFESAKALMGIVGIVGWACLARTLFIPGLDYQMLGFGWAFVGTIGYYNIELARLRAKSE